MLKLDLQFFACSSCSSSCWSASTQSSCSSCANSCSGACSSCSSECGDCSGKCTGGCGGSCKYTCSGSCGSSCSGSCSGECGSCTNACTGCTSCSGCSGCSGSCDGCSGCSGSCSSCSGTCTSCSGTCVSGCNDACQNASMLNVMNTLGYNILAGGYIKDEDFYELKYYLSQELNRRRRSAIDENYLVTPTHGDYVQVDHASKLASIVKNLSSIEDYRSRFASGYVVNIADLDDIVYYIRALLREQIK